MLFQKLADLQKSLGNSVDKLRDKGKVWVVKSQQQVVMKYAGVKIK